MQQNQNGKGLVLARPTTSAPKVWDEYYRQAEELAALVEKEFNGCCQKLRDLKPQIEAVREAFKTLTGSKTIAGCRSFPEYCDKKLHRTKQATPRLHDLSVAERRRLQGWLDESIGEAAKAATRYAKSLEGLHRQQTSVETQLRKIPAEDQITGIYWRATTFRTQAIRY